MKTLIYCELLNSIKSVSFFLNVVNFTFFNQNLSMMYKFTLLIVLALFIQFIVSAQPRLPDKGPVQGGQACLPDGITFSTQEQIDNFQTNYPNCSEIEGSVAISGDDITNLNGLNVLTSIGGDLMIGDQELSKC